MAFPIDREYALSTLQRLVQINSINPSLVPGAPGEREAAHFISQSLQLIGMQVDTWEVEACRASVLGRMAGSGGGRSLMLNAHCDTVDVQGMTEPFREPFGMVESTGAALTT